MIHIFKLTLSQISEPNSAKMDMIKFIQLSRFLTAAIETVLSKETIEELRQSTKY